MLIALTAILVFSLSSGVIAGFYTVGFGNFSDPDLWPHLRYFTLYYFFFIGTFVLIPVLMISCIINYLYQLGNDFNYIRIVQLIYLSGVIMFVTAMVLDNYKELFVIAFSLPISVHLYLYLLENRIKGFYKKKFATNDKS